MVEFIYTYGTKFIRGKNSLYGDRGPGWGKYKSSVSRAQEVYCILGHVEAVKI